MPGPTHQAKSSLITPKPLRTNTLSVTVHNSLTISFPNYFKPA
jgi:hypothetical protein